MLKAKTQAVWNQDKPDNPRLLRHTPDFRMALRKLAARSGPPLLRPAGPPRASPGFAHPALCTSVGIRKEFCANTKGLLNWVTSRAAS